MWILRSFRLTVEPLGRSQARRRPAHFLGRSGGADGDEVVGRIANLRIAESVEEHRDTLRNALRDAGGCSLWRILAESESARRAVRAQRRRSAVLEHESEAVGAASQPALLGELELEDAFEPAADRLFVAEPRRAGHIVLRRSQAQHPAFLPRRSNQAELCQRPEIGKVDRRRLGRNREQQRRAQPESRRPHTTAMIANLK